MDLFKNLWKKRGRDDRVAPLPHAIQAAQDAADKFDSIWEELQEAHRRGIIIGPLYRGIQNAYLLRDFRGIARQLRAYQKTYPHSGDLFLPILAKLENALLDYEVAQFSMNQQGYKTHLVENAPKITDNTYQWVDMMGRLEKDRKYEDYKRRRAIRENARIKRTAAWSGGGKKRKSRKRTSKKKRTKRKRQSRRRSRK